MAPKCFDYWVTWAGTDNIASNDQTDDIHSEIQETWHWHQGAGINGMCPDSSKDLGTI